MSRRQQQLIEQQAMNERRTEFIQKANHFVGLWNKVMRSYTDKGTLNVKDVRALSKAFRELQATGWPQ